MVNRPTIGITSAQERSVRLEKTQEKQRSIQRGQRLLELENEFEKEGMVFRSSLPVGASEDEVIRNLEGQLAQRKEQRVRRPNFDRVQSQGHAPLGRQIEAAGFGITALFPPLIAAELGLSTAGTAAAGLVVNPKETLEEVRDRGGSVFNPVDIGGAASKTAPGPALAGEITGAVLAGGGIGATTKAGRTAITSAAKISEAGAKTAVQLGVKTPTVARNLGAALADPRFAGKAGRALRDVVTTQELRDVVMRRNSTSGFKGLLGDLPATRKLTEYIKIATPSRIETDLLRAQENVRRNARLDKALRSKGNEFQGIKKELGRARGQSLSGEMPIADFQPPKELGFSLGDEEALWDAIASIDRGVTEGFFKGAFDEASYLDTLADVIDGKIPTKLQISRLSLLFGDEFGKALLKHRSWTTKAREAFWQIVLGVPRTIMAGFGLDAVRQARPVLTPLLNPFSDAAKVRMAALKNATAAVGRTAFSDVAAESLWRQQVKSEAGIVGLKHGLDIVTPNSRMATQASGRTEGFTSNYAQLIPFLGPIIKASERANASFFNTLRLGLFKGHLDEVRHLDELRKVDPTAGGSFIKIPGLRTIKPGESLANSADLNRMARYLNAATGRGNLPAWINKNADIFTNVFFSPRFFWRQFELPFGLISRSPAVRKATVRDMTGMVMSGVGILAMAKASGLDVEIDPRSSDFGRIRHNSIRFDFWGGMRPIAVFVARVWSGEVKSTGSGLISEDEDQVELVMNFLRAKLSPAAALAVDIQQGETVIGEEVVATGSSIGHQARQRLLPLVIQDIVEAGENEGIIGAGVASLAMIGVDSATYLTQQDVVNPYLETSIKVMAPDGSRITEFDDQRLSQAQRAQILADPRIQIELKRVNPQRKVDDLQVERAAALERRKVGDYRLARGEKSGQQWRRDLVLSRMLSATRAQTREAIEGRFSRKPRNDNDRALQEYYQIAEDHTIDATSISEIDPDRVSRLSFAEREQLDRAFDLDGFNAAVDEYLASLSDEQREYVLDNIHPDRTPTENLYYTAQRVLRQYWAIPDRIIRNPRLRALYEQYVSMPQNLQGAFLERNPQLRQYISLIDNERQQLRRRNRTIDDALVLFYDRPTQNLRNTAESRYGRDVQRTRRRVAGRGPERLAKDLGLEITQ